MLLGGSFAWEENLASYSRHSGVLSSALVCERWCFWEPCSVVFSLGFLRGQAMPLPCWGNRGKETGLAFTEPACSVCAPPDFPHLFRVYLIIPHFTDEQLKLEELNQLLRIYCPLETLDTFGAPTCEGAREKRACILERRYTPPCPNMISRRYPKVWLSKGGARPWSWWSVHLCNERIPSSQIIMGTFVCHIGGGKGSILTVHSKDLYVGNFVFR